MNTIKVPGYPTAIFDCVIGAGSYFERKMVKMASKLDEARKIINEVDTKMAELFVKRMRASEMVYEHKKEFGLPILDQKREDAIIEKNSALIEDEPLSEEEINELRKLIDNR